MGCACVGLHDPVRFWRVLIWSVMLNINNLAPNIALQRTETRASAGFVR